MQRLAFMGLIALALAFSAPSTTHAQASRTWVSGVGNDANPCSRTAPCQTFAGAISKTASGGEIDALDPGGFGALTITKSITIDGGGGQVASVLVAGTNGIVVAAGATDVVILRNLRFEGLLGNGSNSGNAGINAIRLISGAALGVENCDISGFNTWGIDFEPNSAASLYVTNTTLTNNGTTSGGGIQVLPTGGVAAKAVVSNTAMENGRAGLTVDSSFNGAGPITVAVENSVSSGNQKAGFTGSAASGPVTLALDHVVANNNGSVGVQSVGGLSTVFLGNSTVTGNKTGVSTTSGGQLLSYKNNQINGNTTDGTPLTAVPSGPLN